MADLPSAVTDTHPLIFYAAQSGVLGSRARRLFDAAENQQSLLYVPAAAIWETSLLARVGKVNLRRSVRIFFDELFSNPAYQPFDLTAEQVYLADELRFTRDPFDGLIVAAARTLDVPLITRDAVIRASAAVRVIW
jgi:PIN domain nuclease of toxin-antitoxin system